MNNILISNPFLFRPSSPSDNSTQEEIQAENFLSYQASEFEKAWESYTTKESEKRSSSSESESDSGISSISSPTISSTNTFVLPFEEDSMESNWLSQGGFTFEQLDASADTTDVLSPDFTDDNAFSANFLGDFVLPEDMDFDDIMNDIKKRSVADMINNDQNPMISPSLITPPNLTTTVTGGQFSDQYDKSFPETEINLSSLLSSSPAPNLNLEPEPNYVVNILTIQQQHGHNTRGTHPRKATLGQRVVAPSPFHSHQEPEEAVDVKPDIQALGINNGQVRRKRNISTASNNEAEASTSGGKSKKPRKYEIEDPNDPSVRNARAAKLNRDRKKREFLDMKERAEAAEDTVSNLRTENEQLKAKYEAMSAQLNQQIVKNRTMSGLHRQMTNMKNVFEAILPGMNNKFGRQMAVEVPDSFASIPAALDENGQLAMHESGDAINADNFNILDPSFQMPEGNENADKSSDYITLHINPHEGKIRLDYDPSFQ